MFMKMPWVFGIFRIFGFYVLVLQVFDMDAGGRRDRFDIS
jgi:hypothetical protein